MKRAFSLVEVVLAVAIFATTVLAVTAWLRPGGRTGSGFSDHDTAARLAEEVRIELLRRRDSLVPAGGMSRLDRLAEEIGPTGLRLVADRSGTVLRLEAVADEPDGLAQRDRHYLIQVEPEAGALAYRDDAGFLALSIAIRWPYWRPTGPAEAEAVLAPSGAASRLRIPVALTP